MSTDQSDRKPGDFADVPISYDDPWNAVRPEQAAENLHIANQGIKFDHWMCIPDPLFQHEIGDVRHSFGYEDGFQQVPDSDRFHRENGWLYVKNKSVYGTFMGNAKDFKAVAAGLYGDSGATISLNRFYIDTDEKIQISENDKLIPCDLKEEFFSVNWQKFTHNPTGIDRMQFKVCKVVFLIDSDGIQYIKDRDFAVENGYIKWIDGADRPGLDKQTGKGKVCAIRYTYKPQYYIQRVLHDIRMRPMLTQDGEVTPKAGPQLVQVQADWIYLERRTNNDKDVAAAEMAGDGKNTGPR